MKDIKLWAVAVALAAAVPAEGLVVRLPPQAPRYVVKAGLPAAARTSFRAFAGTAFQLAPSLQSSLQLGVAPVAPERVVEALPVMTAFALKAGDVGKHMAKGDLSGAKKGLDELYNPTGRGGNGLIPPGDESSRNNRGDEGPVGQAALFVKARLEQGRLYKVFGNVVESADAAVGDTDLPGMSDDEGAERLAATFDALERQAAELDELGQGLDQAMKLSQKEAVAADVIFGLLDRAAAVNVNLPLFFAGQVKEAVVKVGAVLEEIRTDLARVPALSPAEAEAFKQKYLGDTVEIARAHAEERLNDHVMFLDVLNAIDKALALPESLTVELRARVEAMTQALEKAAELAL